MAAPAGDGAANDEPPWLSGELTSPLIQKYENRIRELEAASVLNAEAMEDMRRKIDEVTTVRKPCPLNRSGCWRCTAGPVLPLVSISIIL